MYLYQTKFTLKTSSGSEIKMEGTIDIEQIEAVLDNSGSEYSSIVYMKSGRELRVRMSGARIAGLMDEARRAAL